MNSSRINRTEPARLPLAAKVAGCWGGDGLCAGTSTRTGFTLVEMLVSVALVVLMMLMFAQIFEITAGSITAQRGIAENDQRARMLSTVISGFTDAAEATPMVKGDLANRTFRTVMPFRRQQNPAIPGGREGYFYISENNPENDADDVLQFTVEAPFKRLGGAKVQETFGGRAQPLGSIVRRDIDNDGNDEVLYTAHNQPDADDGQVLLWDIDGDGTLDTVIPGDEQGQTNTTGESRYAEVSYFLRDGNLYRRVLLLREPYDGSAVTPTALDGSRLIPGVYPNSVPRRNDATFWNDFDYSAHYDGDNGRPFFHGKLTTASAGGGRNSLSNIPGRGQYPLGHPFTRFGHDHQSGNPRELVDASAGTGPDNFIGRFTHHETSHPDFGYPGRIPAAGSPMARGTALTLSNGVVTEYDNRPQAPPAPDPDRRGEEILLTNVIAFDVKVWDSALGQFADVGHGIPGGDYSQIKNQHLFDPNSNPPQLPPSRRIMYGPHGPFSNRAVLENRIFDTWHPELDIDDDDEEDPPPFRALARDSNGDPFGPDGEPGEAGVNDDGNVDAQGNPLIDDLGEDTNANGRLDPGEDANGNGVLDSEVGYIGTDDEQPLESIQITIRYLDTDTGQMRQLTIEHSLVNQ